MNRSIILSSIKNNNGKTITINKGENIMKQEFTSANTSINSTKVPAVFKAVQSAFGWEKCTRNLDWGGGKYNTAAEWFKESDLLVTNYIYDPYNQSAENNEEVLKAYPYDTVTVSNVLNVIKEPEIRFNVVKEALTHLKVGGKLFITVYEGDKSGIGKPSKKGCWQENRALSAYITELSEFCPIKVKNMLVIEKTLKYSIREEILEKLQEALEAVDELQNIIGDIEDLAKEGQLTNLMAYKGGFPTKFDTNTYGELNSLSSYLDYIKDEVETC